MKELKTGKSIRHSVVGTTLGPACRAKAVATSGQAHSASGKYVDLMGLIDTLLDVGMARRFRRAIRSPADEAVHLVKNKIYAYEMRARHIYEHFRDRLTTDTDTKVDEKLNIGSTVEAICSENIAR